MASRRCFILKTNGRSRAFADGHYIVYMDLWNKEVISLRQAQNFLKTLLHTHQIPLCRRMLGSNSGLRHWQSDALTTQLDLIQKTFALFQIGGQNLGKCNLPLTFLIVRWLTLLWLCLEMDLVMVPSGELHISSVDYRSDIHCTENPIYLFPEMKLRGLVPYSYIHVSVSN